MPGRSFVSYLISLSTTVSSLHHLVYLDSHCQQDLHMWHKCLKGWNGVSLFYDSRVTSAHDMEHCTNASLIGFGAFFQNQWFSAEWPVSLPSIHEADLSMAFPELYPIVAAAVVWGKYWTSKRIMFISDNEATIFIIRKMRSKVFTNNEAREDLNMDSGSEQFSVQFKTFSRQIQYHGSTSGFL